MLKTETFDMETSS